MKETFNDIYPIIVGVSKTASNEMEINGNAIGD